jgi:hypothetical protein
MRKVSRRRFEWPLTAAHNVVHILASISITTALIVSWDKQLSALFGRYVWLPLMDVSCEVPAPYANVPEDSHLQPAILDAKYIEIFNAQIGISSVLTLALRSVIHRPLFPQTKFLDQLVDKMWGEHTDEQDLKEVEKQLEKWRA